MNTTDNTPDRILHAIAADCELLSTALGNLPHEYSSVVFTSAERLKSHSSALYSLAHDYTPASAPLTGRDTVKIDLLHDYCRKVSVLIAAASGVEIELRAQCGHPRTEALASGVHEAITDVVKFQATLPAE